MDTPIDLRAYLKASAVQRLPPWVLVEIAMAILGWTQADLGAAIGVSQPFLSKLRSGRPMPAQRAQQIEELFGIPANRWT